MSKHRTRSLVVSVLIGVSCIATLSTDAFAYRRVVGVGRVGVGHVGVHRYAPVRRGVAVGVGVGVGAAAVGYHARHCGYYPYPPCY
jgi:hypothetical protein